MLDGGEIALELRHQRRVGAALEHLGDEGAAGVEHVGGKGGGAFDQAEDAQLVGLAMAGGVGGHVGQHHVGAAAHHRQQLFGRIIARGNRAARR